MLQPRPPRPLQPETWQTELLRVEREWPHEASPWECRRCGAVWRRLLEEKEEEEQGEEE